MTVRPATLLVSLISISQAGAADWPQYRGPDRTGVSKETGLLKAWPKEGPKLQWTFKNAGAGHSSFAVVGDKLYTLGTRGEDEIVLALDSSKGSELWTAKIGPLFTFKGNRWGDGPRGTPTIDGDRLYALGGHGDLVCLDLANMGKEVWRKSLQKDFGGEMMTYWGYSESPLVDAGQLICTPGGEKGTLAALDKKDGRLIWQSKDLTNKAPYSSIMPAAIHGVRQYIQNSYDDGVGGFVSGVAAKDGKVLWSMPTFKGSSYDIAPTPVVKDNLVYVTTYDSQTIRGCHCFEIDKAFKAKDLYAKDAQTSMKNNHGGVVLIGAHIFGHSQGKRAGWVCQELKTGNIVWAETGKLTCESGAITAAEGLLYLLSDEGEVGLVQASPKEFKELSSFKLPEASKIPENSKTSKSSKIWAHPVVANGSLFLRDHDLIFCFDVKGK